MPAPIPGGKVEKNAQRHLRKHDQQDVTDAIEIAQLVMSNKKEEAVKRLAVLAKRNQADSEIGLYLETGLISDADDVIMDVTAAAHREEARR